MDVVIGCRCEIHVHVQRGSGAGASKVGAHGASSVSEDCETLTGATFLRRFGLEGREGGGGARDVGGGFGMTWVCRST